MSMFEWKQDYSLGHGTIDGEHKKLFEFANELHAAMMQGKGKDVMSEILARLIDYTKTHFAHEESLMREHHYPDYLKHKAEHDELTAKVVAFQKEFVSGHGTITVGLLQFLKDWLKTHIGETDRKVAVFLKSHVAA